jgi:uncharacterized membrane protein HdeD (DUF308 family)
MMSPSPDVPFTTGACPSETSIPTLSYLTARGPGLREDSSLSGEVGTSLQSNPDAMESERSRTTRTTRETRETRETEEVPGLRLSRGLGIALGAITLILGVIIAFRPTQSLAAIAVLFGVVMMVSGVFQLARAIGGREHERVWRGLAGVVFFLVGLALVRHLNVTVALIGLFIGIAWIIQGISALVESFGPDRERLRTGWTVFFGIISLIAGIVLVSAPIESVTALTIFLGIWFIVMGILEIIGSLIAKPVMTFTGAAGVSVPQQRADMAADERRAEREATARDDTADHGAAGGNGPASRNFPS